MAREPALAVGEARNVYGDSYISGNARVTQGNVYISNSHNDDDIERDKTKAKAGR